MRRREALEALVGPPWGAANPARASDRLAACGMRCEQACMPQTGAPEPLNRHKITDDTIEAMPGFQSSA
jgi:hypothetical protein